MVGPHRASRIYPTVAAVLLAGCAALPGASPGATRTTGTGGPTSPLPTSDQASLAAPTAAAHTGWPYRSQWSIRDALFGDDGRVVLVVGLRDAAAVEQGGMHMTVLEPDGSTAPGWPWTPPSTGGVADTVQAVFGPDGSLYVLVRVATAVYPINFAWSVHRVSRDGAEMTGFPANLALVSYCGLPASRAGVAYVTCVENDEATGVSTTVVSALRSDGSSVPGWPVRLPGEGTATVLSPAGTIFIETQSGDTTRLAAVRADGTALSGWPREVAFGTFKIDDSGRVRITHYDVKDEICGPAARTVYSMLEPDGEPARGWPIAIDGWASEPEVATDGTMYVVTHDGRALAYSASGRVVDGWPVSAVDVALGCGADGSRAWSAGDDTILVVGNDAATLLEADGRMASGWPVQLPYTPAEGCTSCVPGPGAPMPPAIGRSGIYIGAYDNGSLKGPTAASRLRIVVVARDGSIRPADQAVFGDWDLETWVRIAPTGRVWALVTSPGSSSTLYLVAEDGIPAR